MINSAYTDLIAQLRAVKYNDKGHPDKTELSFDLGDCLLMGCNHFRNSKVRIISVPMDKTHNSYSYEVSDYVCNSCKDGTHSNTNHSLWIQDQDDEDGVRTITCKCGKCNP